MELHIYKSAKAACEAAALLLAAQITQKGDSVLGLATGSTPIPTYEALARLYREGLVDFSRVRTFNLDEYIGIDRDNPLSYHAFMREHLFSKVNLRPENTRLPEGETPQGAAAYDEAIRAAGGIDMQLLGIGRNGHIGFNEPSDAFVYGTHVVALAQDTLDANARFFESVDQVPRTAISMGVGGILAARCVVLIATGESKAQALYDAVRGPVTPRVPASALQLHPRAVILADCEAAALLCGREGA